MAATTQTTGLKDAMRDAMATRHVTFRGLAERIAELGVRNGRGLTHPYLNQVASGKERPSLDAIDAICRALELDPATIVEYQLAVARRMFDERPPPFGVGRDEALANLKRYGFVSTGTPSEAAQELAQNLESAALRREGTERRSGGDRRRRGAAG